MLPISEAVEPASFDAAVRQPGLAYVGSLASIIGATFDGREYWRRAIPQLRAAYSCICAYTNHWIALDTGGNSVEHFVPKSINANLAYEWSNLRFVCSRLNARRGIRNIIDPFDIQAGMFELRFPSLFIIVPDAHSANNLLNQTIEILKLNDDLILESRDEYVKNYANGHISIEYLRQKAPFICFEIERLGLNRPDLLAMGF